MLAVSDKSNTKDLRLGELLQADEHLHAYILLDPMLREPLDERLLDDCGALVKSIPVRHSSLRDDQCPRLISLRPQAVDLLDASLRAAENEQSDPSREVEAGFAIGGWLLSAVGIDEVARHLARIMGACSAQGAGRRYVRLADRRVFEWLWPLLDGEQRAILLGPVTSWVTLDRCGGGVPYTLDQPRIQAYTGASLALTAAQWSRLQQCELIQAMIRGWRQFATSLPADYLTHAANAVDAAQGLGLSNQRDILLLGAYQLQVHPRLCTHPRVIEVVAGAVDGNIPLFVALESIPDPDGWDAIRKQLQHAGASARSNARARA